MGRTNYKYGKANKFVLAAAVSPQTAIRFRDMCDRKGVSQSSILRGLVEGAVAADKFVHTAIGDYEGQFEVDVLLPDVDAGKMQLHCAMMAELNRRKEAPDEHNS